VVTFQPHRYTRTGDLMNEFAPALKNADQIVLTDIYAAGEAPIEGVTIESLVNSFPADSPVTYLPRKVLTDELLPMLRPGDLLLTLGAGDITLVGGEILERLGKASAI